MKINSSKSLLKTLSPRKPQRNLSSRATPGFGMNLKASPSQPVLRNILIPVDFSKAAKKAVLFATALAEPLGASITLIHIVDHVKSPADFGYGPVLQKFPDKGKRRHAKSRLKRLAHSVCGKWIPWNVFVLDGEAHEMIVRAAKEMHADMVILPVHEHDKMDAKWPKTILNYTVHNLSCPVLVFQGHWVANKLS